MEPRLHETDGYYEIWITDTTIVPIEAVRDEYPEPLKEALARYRQSMLKGECPCGGRVHSAHMNHNPGCPALNKNRLLGEFLSSPEGENARAGLTKALGRDVLEGWDPETGEWS